MTKEELRAALNWACGMGSAIRATYELDDDEEAYWELVNQFAKQVDEIVKDFKE